MRWNIGHQEELKRRWAANESTERIAVAFGVSGQTIRVKARELGLAPRPSGGPKRADVVRDAEMAQMRRAGQTYAEIAAHFGVSAPCVLYACRRQGIATKPERHPNRDRVLSEQHRQAIREGMLRRSAQLRAGA